MNMHQRISVRVKQKTSALDRSNACETPYYPAAGPIDEHAARVRYPLLSFIFFPGRLVDLGSRQASHAPNFFYHPNANPVYIYNLASVHGSSLIPATTTSQHSEIEREERRRWKRRAGLACSPRSTPTASGCAGPSSTRSSSTSQVHCERRDRCRLASVCFFS